MKLFLNKKTYKKINKKFSTAFHVKYLNIQLKFKERDTDS